MERNDQKPRSKFGRRYDEEFKRDAAKMMKSGLRTAERLASELGVSVWSLNRWAKDYANEMAVGGPPGSVRFFACGSVSCLAV